MKAARASETRAALIRAARLLFAQKGFHATGTTKIVALAGVSRGALQPNSARKEDLFLAVFDEVERGMVDGSMLQADEGPGARWVGFKTNFSSFLDAVTMPEVQRIILIDGPAVVGWAEWRPLEAHYGLGIIGRAVVDGMEAEHIRRQQPFPLAHLSLSIIDESALMVANANDPEVARHDVRLALQTLLTSLA